MDGFIKIQKETSPIFNDVGEEISVSQGFEQELIMCKYHTKTDISVLNETGGGFFTQLKYIITTKTRGIKPQRVQLFDRNKNLICEKDCQSVEDLHTIQRTKIVI